MVKTKKTIRDIEKKWEHVSCVVCGTDDAVKIAEDSVGGDIFNIVRCRKCGFIFVDPRRIDINSSAYFMEDISEYHKKHLGYFKKNVFHDVLGRISEVTNGKDLLDVGAGLGYFLYLCKKNGFNACGVEPSPSFAEYAVKKYDVDVKNGFLERADFQGRKFDVLVMMDVIEHVLNLDGLIEESKKVIKDNGFIVLRFPNAVQHKLKEKFARPLYRFYRKSLWCSEVGGHINFFSDVTINLFLIKHGFEVISVTNSRTELHHNRILSFLKVCYERIAKLTILLSSVYIANSLIVIAKKIDQ